MRRPDGYREIQPDRVQEFMEDFAAAVEEMGAWAAQ
jgi:hypothetical protein